MANKRPAQTPVANMVRRKIGRKISNDKDDDMAKVVDEKDEYEIETILFHETVGNQEMYLVKWKNCPVDQCTWEPQQNLTNCQQVLNNYKSSFIMSKHPNKSNSELQLKKKKN